MRILMVIGNFYPVVGGTEKQCFELSAALASMGHQVSVLTRNPSSLPQQETVSGFEIRRINVFGPIIMDSLIFMFGVFKEILLSKRPDIIHVHMVSSFSLAVLAAAGIRNIKTVFSISGGKDLNEFSMSSKTFAGKIKLFFLSKVHLDILVKNSQTYQWLKKEGSPKWKLRLFKNGVDTFKYNVPLIDEKMKAKEKTGAFGFNFLFVGRLSKEKRVKEFIEIFAEVCAQESAKKINLLIVGEGPCGQEIRDAVSSLGLKDRVFLYGRQYELKDYYHACEVFVLPSISEGLSNSMLEAMSCGLAVAASRVGGACELIKDGENGCLFDPLNRKEIKECLKKAVDCPDIKEMGKINRKIAVENYSMNIVAKELLSIYGE